MTQTEPHASATPFTARKPTRLSAGGTSGRARRARTQAMLVRPLRDGRYVVETEGGTYVVDLEAESCTCPDHQLRGADCKHRRRVTIEVTERRVPAPDQRTAICATCGEPTFVPRSAIGSQLCDRHTPTPGDPVRDRETGKLLVVTAVTTDRADERIVEERDQSIAAFASNEQYGDHEPVIEAVYVPRNVRSMGRSISTIANGTASPPRGWSRSSGRTPTAAGPPTNRRQRRAPTRTRRRRRERRPKPAANCRQRRGRTEHGIGTAYRSRPVVATPYHCAAMCE